GRDALRTRTGKTPLFMTGAAGAFLLLALQLFAGTFALMCSTMIVYKSVGRGHYRALVWVLGPLIVAVGFLLPKPLNLAALATGVLVAVFLGAVYSQRPLLEWITGGLAAAAAVFVLILPSLSSCASECVARSIQAIAGGFFLGAVTHGMVLGHWYLNQPRLPIEPLKAQVRLIIVSLAVSIAAVLITFPTLLRGEVKGVVLPISSSGYLWGWGLLVATVAVLSLMIRSTVASRSTQSATGLMYVAMVPALGAQFLVNLLLFS
ncbi:MAG: hypothetical protein ACRD1T_11770, partial [Acidimicrobiia bacterium]